MKALLITLAIITTDYYLVGDAWQTQYNSNSGFVVKVADSIQVDNLGMKERQFITLMKHINSLPDLTAYSSDWGVTFTIENESNLDYLLDEIRIYFN